MGKNVKIPKDKNEGSLLKNIASRERILYVNTNDMTVEQKAHYVQTLSTLKRAMKNPDLKVDDDFMFGLISNFTKVYPHKVIMNGLNLLRSALKYTDTIEKRFDKKIKTFLDFNPDVAKFLKEQKEEQEKKAKENTPKTINDIFTPEAIDAMKSANINPMDAYKYITINALEKQFGKITPEQKDKFAKGELNLKDVIKCKQDIEKAVDKTANRVIGDKEKNKDGQQDKVSTSVEKTESKSKDERRETLSQRGDGNHTINDTIKSTKTNSKERQRDNLDKSKTNNEGKKEQEFVPPTKEEYSKQAIELSNYARSQQSQNNGGQKSNETNGQSSTDKHVKTANDSQQSGGTNGESTQGQVVNEEKLYDKLKDAIEKQAEEVQKEQEEQERIRRMMGRDKN